MRLNFFDGDPASTWTKGFAFLPRRVGVGPDGKPVWCWFRSYWWKWEGTAVSTKFFHRRTMKDAAFHTYEVMGA